MYISKSTSYSKDNVLAIKGNGFLNNTVIPGKIVAGDTYAKQQAWEISFNLSALSTGDGEVTLLNLTSGSC